jgi:hypothetical protein
MSLGIKGPYKEFKLQAGMLSDTYRFWGIVSKWKGYTQFFAHVRL